jgi:hypothetical protein
MKLYLRNLQSIIEFVRFKRKFGIKYNCSLKNKKKTIFIFGSGPSLNKLTKSELSYMNESGSVMGFNDVFNFNKIKFDYYIIREFFDLKYFFKKSPWKYAISSIYNKINMGRVKNFSKLVEKDCNLIYHIDSFSGSVILAFYELVKIFPNYLFYKTNSDRKRKIPFSDRLDDISHSNCSLADAIQIASIIGYKKIVLVGVDLGSRGHFFDNNYSNQFHKTLPWISSALKLWRDDLIARDISVEIYNPNSMLNNILQVYDKKSFKNNRN